MSRIKQRFDSLKQQGRKALIPFITAGDPVPATTVPLMHALVDAGADLLELGVPFSDPMADGPVIQHASERALKNGVTLKDVMAMVAEFRQQDAQTPVVLMGYLNPVEVMGYTAFADQAAAAGVDGALTIDLPPEEAEELVTALKSVEIDPIFLLAPTSTEARIDRITDQASGFLYYVSLRGVTGASNLDMDEVKERLETIRRHTDLPVGVGFGINKPETAAAVAGFADAVVVGSAVVRRLAEHINEPSKITSAITAFMKELRTAMDNTGRDDQQASRGHR